MRTIHPATPPRFEPLEDRATPATLTITNLGDVGVGSLRDAITQASSETYYPGPDTIVFAPNLSGQTIGLTTIGDSGIGPSALLINTPVTIAGSGQTITRSGGTAFRLFVVAGAGSLTLRDLTLSNGLARGGDGGVPSSGGGGGGGAAGLGGAIYNQGTLTITGCTITGNQAVGGANVGGGAGGGGGLSGPGTVNGNGGPPNGGHFNALAPLGSPPTGTDGGFGGGGGAGENGAGEQTARGGTAGGYGGGGGGGGVGAPGGPGPFDIGGSFGGDGKSAGFGGGGGGGGRGGTGDPNGAPGNRGLAGFGGGDGAAGNGAAASGTGGGGAGMGGAVFNQGGTVVITNSTIAGNTAAGGNAPGATGGSGYGAGLFNLNGSITLTHVTIAVNTVTAGTGSTAGQAAGAVYSLGRNVETALTPGTDAALEIANCIVASTVGGPDLVNHSELFGQARVTTTGPNLVSVAVANTGSSVTGTPFTVANPLLGPLTYSGGPTATMTPQTGSPALDVGSNAAATGLANDQRGMSFVRVFNGTVDLGAIEVQPGLRSVLVGGLANGTAQFFGPGSTPLVAGATHTLFPGLGVNVRTATADVNGDGTPDFSGGTGPGQATQIVVLDGATNAKLATFTPFETSFTGGVFVTAADLDGDGKAEVVVSPDQGGGPIAAIYSGAKLAAGLTGDAAQLLRFFAIDDPAFRGGARPTLGDITGDGKAELTVSAGFLGGPRITVWDGQSILNGVPRQLLNFFAFENTLRNGAFVSAGDVTGDGRADLIFGGGPGGAPRVRVFDGQALLGAGSFGTLDEVGSAQRANFFAGDSSLRGGVRLAMRDVNADGKADLVTGSGEGEASRVRVFLAGNLLANASPTADQELDPFGIVLANGVFVG